ncbi:UDP-N-acetylglucosamine 3-dehydrogenase [Methanococcoides vulcani]|uniref:UDP-N-acetylglucosamine 3-dehydrogenase n=1 Tax=Methanococcoides vulcani TaxID=1353158 RepID=A0A1I0A6U9_9EURY|nr:UDP-N-acetylglucosamine 3-dehydrogenase [Methanococcoides vulcani]SES89871.1 UDP-N-acetylglucosamine 3-dehydrogenase [Methanococcoides vulcani]
MLRVGVIGVGAMGQHHVRIYNEMEGVELVGISDVDKYRVEELAEKYGIKAYTNHKELLKENLDAVSIVVPTTLHKEVTLDAINSDTDVLVEKPIADTLENADIMIEAAEKAGVILMVGQIERFNPATTKMKEIIDSGLLGKIVSITTKRVGPYNPRIRDVGIILDLGVHDIDAIAYMYGCNVTEVYAIAGRDIHPKEDHASIMLRFGDEQAGVVNINWLTPHKVRKMEVIGVEGVGYLDYVDQTVTIHDAKWVRNAKVEKAEPLQKELEHFINCVREGDTPLESGIDGKHALKVALSAIESYNSDSIIRTD